MSFGHSSLVEGMHIMGLLHLFYITEAIGISQFVINEGIGFRQFGIEL